MNRKFSAPGRVEIGGNHTDHQNGMVLTAAVDLYIWCSASVNGENKVNITSSQHPSFSVDLAELSIHEDEKETSAALVRGVAEWFVSHGHKIGGFDATVSSNIPVGAGLSSSAAFEVLIGNVFKGLYGAGTSPLDIALAGKYAENNYFGKPCGLMDQAASSFGGLNVIDFSDPENAKVTPVKTDFSDYIMCIVDTGSSHADLTPKYAAIPYEMMLVAGHYGRDYLYEVESEKFYSEIGRLRKSGMSDRALLRAIHFFEENARVQKQADALEHGNMREFLELTNASGRSSLAYLQNVFSGSDDAYRQGLTLALALSEKVLGDKGAWRVHGGGFAGTIMAFVPKSLKSDYEKCMCRVFGENACHFLNISRNGGMEITA